MEFLYIIQLSIVTDERINCDTDLYQFIKVQQIIITISRLAGSRTKQQQTISENTIHMLIENGIKSYHASSSL